MRAQRRFPLMVLGIVALLVGLWTGLARIGWGLPLLATIESTEHGPLMVPGFLGTLIGLERAVALGAQRRQWGYLVPLLAGIGSLALIVGLASVGALLLTLAGLGLAVVYAFLVRRQPTLFMTTEALGALALLTGTGLWSFGRPVPSVVPWWMAFLVLTIVGERLELARMWHLSAGARGTFLGALILALLATALTVVSFDLAVRLLGVGLVALGIWLARYDVVTRTIRKPGVTRFSGVCLASGFIWLAVGGALALLIGGTRAGPLYDAWLHSVFLGFVFSMIFGHAPIIFPAVLRVRMAYHPMFYAHWALLHLSLIGRVWGALEGDGLARQWGGLLNVLAILFFLLNTLWAIRAGLRARQ